VEARTPVRGRLIEVQMRVVVALAAIALLPVSSNAYAPPSQRIFELSVKFPVSNRDAKADKLAVGNFSPPLRTERGRILGGT